MRVAIEGPYGHKICTATSLSLSHSQFKGKQTHGCIEIAPGKTNESLMNGKGNTTPRDRRRKQEREQLRTSLF